VKKEAKLSFALDDIYIEKLIVNPRHIEVQIAADMYGNVIHLFDRDCSIQRKRQKLIEEGGEMKIPLPLREKMFKASKDLMKAANYHSLATVEFLVDSDDTFYFLEVNTRIQVEHTVTEELVDLDLIRLQIEIASKKKLTIMQSDVKSKGHVMEFRINAEDPMNDFCPSCGKLEVFSLPIGSNLRIETYLCQGMSVMPFYDSMIGKIIVSGKTREEVLNRSKRILKECMIEGIKTTLPFFIELLERGIFVDNTHHIFSMDMVKQKGR
jgi:acetyl-CoA carboxylase, biotin carboxylase subunit